jgi:bifunctional UDP-N-acetylglucosamine pyrophosphorylase/glucosamine-1-phosphate N-acetyltransferase
LAADVFVEPHVVFGAGVDLASGTWVRSFSHLEGVITEGAATIGPYARLRPGSRLQIDAHVGNFVEIKNALIGSGAKANHLSYIGNAAVGAGANIGAGTITCNYDGVGKHHTEIGAGVFVGSNSALVAPVRIGAGAIIGAGSTITTDIEADAIALARAPQTARAKSAARLRARLKAKRAADEA